MLICESFSALCKKLFMVLFFLNVFCDSRPLPADLSFGLFTLALRSYDLLFSSDFVCFWIIVLFLSNCFFPSDFSFWSLFTFVYDFFFDFMSRLSCSKLLLTPSEPLFLLFRSSRSLTVFCRSTVT